MIIPTKMQQTQANADFLSSSEPIQTPVVDLGSSSTAGAGGGGGQENVSGGQETFSPAPSAPTPQTRQNAAFLGSGAPGPVQSQIFGGLRQGAAEQVSGARELERGFLEAAGEAPELQGTRNTIKGYLNTGQGLDAAQSLLNASYEGPRQGSDEEIARLQAGQADLFERARALQSGVGLQSLISQAAPGLTRGEARFEAQRTIQDPGFRQERRDVQGDLRQSAAELGRRQERIGEEVDFRDRRAQQIQDLARGYVQDRERALESDLANQQLQALGRQNAVEQLYEQLSSGDKTYLQTAKQLGITPSPGVERALEAQRLYDAIFNDPRYASIRDYGPLAYTINPRGREAYATPGDRSDPLYKAVRRGDVSQEQNDLLVSREEQLRDLFGFRPGFDDTPGRFADVLSIDEAGNVSRYQPGNLAGFLDLEGGVSPTRENISTDKQRQLYNRLSELQGEVDRLAEAEPFRAARIVNDVEGFLAAEEAELAERGENLTRQQEQWQQTIRRARRDYRKARDRNKLGGITGTIGSVLGYAVGGGPVGGAVGGAIGRSIGG